VTKRSLPGREDSLADEGDAAKSRMRFTRGIATEVIHAELDDVDLREKVTRGLGWKLLSVVFGQGSQTLVAILLAHLLLPRDFGIAGMALAFSGLVQVFTDVSLGAALVQRKLLTERDRSTVFWTTVLGGVACTLAGVAVSPFVADFFSTPEVAPLFAAVSVGFTLTALGQTQNALLTREMSFRSLELRQIAATIIGAGVAVALALAGLGPWAIISQSLCTYGASTILLWTLSPWRPQFVFSLESFRTLGSFGLKTLLSKLLLYVNLNGDNLLIGRYLGSEALGVYAVAYNVMLLPMAQIVSPIRDVFYAGFARLQNDPRRLGDVWLRVNRLASSLLVPAFLGLAVVAPDFVPVALGKNWHAAIPVLQLLCLAGIAQSLQAFNGNVYQARGLPGLFLRFMVFSTGVTFSAFVLGLHWGVTGVAGSFAVARAIVLFPNTWLTCRVTELSVVRVLRSYLEIGWMAGVMGAVVYASRVGLVDAGVPAGLRLLLLTILGASVYFGLVAKRSPDLIVEVRTALRSRGSSRTA
jgi:O-antigen/teichoic acid export membrane protein